MIASSLPRGVDHLHRCCGHRYLSLLNVIEERPENATFNERQIRSRNAILRIILDVKFAHRGRLWKSLGQRCFDERFESQDVASLSYGASPILDESAGIKITAPTKKHPPGRPQGRSG